MWCGRMWTLKIFGFYDKTALLVVTLVLFQPVFMLHPVSYVVSFCLHTFLINNEYSR